ncbi:hypothetical protein SAMN05421538_10417 [Paracoccus isoporae]|uniref:Meckel syndrome type 1 protein n=1 Tax=Paracoccus isoporae TaxID=591205 RepID=A0A1G7A3N0_9RHOB|nr:hypothetical protein [Paracoccus isoporae]SDE09351.1 hypothetical protein SAMN05421538_10417 [Paracoccus isoporae]
MNEQMVTGAAAPDRDFALGFQPDGVQLLRRDGGGWSELGRALFTGDLREGLGDFARQLRAANAPGLALVIPEDQILYTDMILPEASDTRDALRAGLDGLTPYPVEDLAYDYAPGDAAPGSTVKIAAVARQTLQEAEDFAVRHGFAPDRFLAAPAAGQFPHMPDFGRTDLASEWARAEELTDMAGGDAEAATDAAGADADADLRSDDSQAPMDAETTSAGDATAPAVAQSTTDPSATPVRDDSARPANREMTSVTVTPAGGESISPPVAASVPVPQPPVISRITAHVVPGLPVHTSETPDAAAPRDAAAAEVGVAALSASTGTITGSVAAAPSVNRGSIILPGETETPPPGAPDPAADADSTGDSTAAPAGEPVTARPAAQMSERARKFHERAQEGRKLRAAPTPPPRAAAPAGRRSGLAGALPLVGVLVLGLGIAAVVTGRDPEPKDSASATPESAVQSQAEAPASADPAVMSDSVQPEAAAPGVATTQAGPGTGDSTDSAPAVQLTEAQGSAEPGAAPAVPADETPQDIAPSADTAGATAVPAVTTGQGSEGQPAAEATLSQPPAQTATSAAARMVESAYGDTDPLPDSAPAATVSDAGAEASEDAPQRTAPAPSAQPTATPQTATATGPADSAGDPAAVTGSARPAARPDGLAARRQAAGAASDPPATSQAQAAPQRSAARAPVSRPGDSAGSTATAPAASRAAPGAPASATLRSSARPVTAPSRSAGPASGSAAPDPRPSVPRSPQPYERRDQPEPTGIRPPPKPETVSSVQGAALQMQPAPRHFSMFSAAGHDAMREFLDAPWRAASQQAWPLIRTAQARPAPRPGRSDAVESAVADALADAVAGDRPPAAPDAAPRAAAPASATASSATPRLSRSARPQRRPGNAAGASTSGIAAAADKAVESAIAEAVSASAAVPGQVGLTALRSSSRPMRRGNISSRNAGTDAAVTAALAAPTERAGGEGTLAPEPQPDAAASKAAAEAAALAERRRLDDELQRQAEQRIRERAAADARAAAQAKAAAEARARAQAEAEAAAARRRNQTYRPPEIDNEPEVQRASVTPSSGSVAGAATSKGIDLNATQLIGTVGAGKASRGLIRLRNGKIVTVRLGDKINGGQITQIGGGGLQYQKGGRKYSLPILNGR